jgi:hypothetical protein
MVSFTLHGGNMTASCRVCGKEFAPDSQTVHRNITYGICAECVAQISETSDNSVLLESIDAPVLLMQGNPRQVVTANRKALELFEKNLHEVERHRGGQLFDCVHSFTEAGCGKDANCENCKIKNAIADTFTTANSHNGVSAELSVRKANGTKTYNLQVSTEKVGDLAFVRVDRYDTKLNNRDHAPYWTA